MPDIRETFCFIFLFFLADNFTGSKDAEPYKTNVSFLCQYTFVSVSYLLCRGFQCHIIFVANQTCLIFGKVFKMPRDRKRRSVVVMAIFLLMKKWSGVFSLTPL